MLSKKFFPILATTALLSLAPVAFGQDYAIPCAVGSGQCDYCEEDKKMKFASFAEPTVAEDFNMVNASAKVGGGYDVWWKVPTPGNDCRLLLFDPFITDKGSVDPNIWGNIVLSTNKGGCFKTHVGTRVAAGACCGSECDKIGAVPNMKRKRSSPLSRVMRSLEPPETKSDGAGSNVQARQWGAESAPGAVGPAVACSKAKISDDTFTKAGIQQTFGDVLNCGGTEGCDISISITLAYASSLSSESSVTDTTGNSVGISITAGYMMAGPTTTVTGSFSQEWSKAISKSTGVSDTTTYTEGFTKSFKLTTGAKYMAWFSPTLDCRVVNSRCNDIDIPMHKCDPHLQNGKPVGEYGVMVVG